METGDKPLAARTSLAMALAMAFALALALRLPQLGIRPLHNDEAVNAVKSIQLWQEGKYAYDPDEYHGPVLHYATVPWLWFTSAKTSADLTDATFRYPTALLGASVLLLFGLLADGIGRRAVVGAAILAAVSPAMVFYSRYFIHEMWLVFFSALALGASWRYCRTGSGGWAAIAGAGWGLMFATKETFVLSSAAAAAGLLAILGIEKYRTPRKPSASTPTAESTPRPESNIDREPLTTDSKAELAGSVSFGSVASHFGVAALACVAVWLVFFSSFFRHFEGLKDSFLTYLPWLKRAGGESPHLHPWSFYMERLLWFQPAKGPGWSEAPLVVLACIGIGVAFGPRGNRLQRFLAAYTIALAGIYSVISYKTPWCMLNFLLGLVLLSGIGADSLLARCRKLPIRIVMHGLLAAVVGVSAWLAWRAAVVYPADRRNPYVYAQTVPDILNLARKADGVAGVAPLKHETVVKVIAPDNDYWPLPWYLRRFRNVGWYDKLPDDPFAPMIVVSSKLEAALDERSGKKWILVGISEMRPRQFMELYVELELWKKYVATLPKEREEDE